VTTPLFHPTLPDEDDPAHLAPLQILLEWLTRVNQWHLRRSLRRLEKGLSDRALPPIYASGVKYRVRGPGESHWLDTPAVLTQGAGDSEDLAAWRAAELRVHGVDAEPVVSWQWTPSSIRASGRSPNSGRWVAHSAVRHPDGRIEDPSKILGRRGFQGRPDGAPRKPLLHLSLPDTGDAAHFAPLQIALEGLTDLDTWQIERARNRAARGLSSAPLPPLYQSGVRYREEEPGHEDWLDTPAVLRQGYADCEDLAAWRAAELRADGFDVEPVIKWQWIPREMMIRQGYPADKLPSRGVWLVHCCVRYPDGSIEDPSKILGMGGNFMERI
jgi:hypothetical protein